MDGRATDVDRAVEAVWRSESPRLIAGLARLVRDIGTAEELAGDALVAALERWPGDGIPAKPGAWLMTIARRRAIDRFRRLAALESRYAALARELAAETAVEPPSAETIDDDVLGLIFAAAHPALPMHARVALTLRFVGGLTTPEIARAFLVPVATMSQRIVRAKRALTEAGARFDVPDGNERVQRLTAVLAVIYLIFNEGYAATSGADALRPTLCDEALRLGRSLAALMPCEAEVQGLVALMEIQASRLRARCTADGEPILLLDQDRTRWDHVLIARGLHALEGAGARDGELGPYGLQAAIAACHARAGTADATDWSRIVALYDALYARTQSPVVALNRAVAVGMADGPHAALSLVDALAHDSALRTYHLLPSVRGDLLVKCGDAAGARAEFRRAAALTQNSRERAFYLQRSARCEAPAFS